MQSCLEKTVSVEGLAGLAWHATGMMTLMTFTALFHSKDFTSLMMLVLNKWQEEK